MPIDPETKKTLDNRLASGEIGIEEYEQILKAITIGERNTPASPILNPIEPSAEPVPQAGDSPEAPRKNEEISHVSRESSLQFKSESSPPPKRLQSRTGRLLKLVKNLVLLTFFAGGIGLIFNITADKFSGLWEAGEEAIPEKEKNNPAWIIGKWEEDDDGKIHGWVPRFMDFESDGTMESGGGLSGMGSADWEYKVKGDLFSITSEIMLPSGNTHQLTLYYTRTNENTIAPATESGRIDGEDRYYKK